MLIFDWDKFSKVADKMRWSFVEDEFSRNDREWFVKPLRVGKDPNEQPSCWSFGWFVKQRKKCNKSEQIFYWEKKNDMTCVRVLVGLVNLQIIVSIDSNKLIWNENERPLMEKRSEKGHDRRTMVDDLSFSPSCRRWRRVFLLLLIYVWVCVAFFLSHSFYVNANGDNNGSNG